MAGERRALIGAGGALDCRALIAAHRTLPFGALVKVCRIIRTRASGLAAKVRSRASFDALPVSAGPCITVTINDRGPYLRGRIIDLTPASVRALGFSGLARVTVEPLGRYRPRLGDFWFF